jgi:hypothetical protein
MQKRAFSLAAAFVCLFLAGQIEGADKAEIDAKIAKAVSYLGEPGDPDSDAKMTFKSIMEAISLAAPETKFPSEFGKSIEKAKDIFKSSSIFSPEGQVYLRKSYRLINSGKAFEMPESISSISHAVDHANAKLDAARKDLEADKTDECVRKLVEIAVMIVTPMHH